jgi:hypothetical protein
VSPAVPGTVRALALVASRRALGPAYPRALARWRRAQGAHRSRRVAAIAREFVAWHGLTVSGGPFAGMVYPDQSATSLVPKLLGLYERELHGAIEEAIRAAPQVIVNVGAADGYYAVGLARRCPAAYVYAFEADPAQRELCRRTVELNGVPARVTLEGTAAPPALRALPDGRTLVVMDCEGCERALLRPEEVPSLRQAAIVVELHDFLEPGVGEAVIERFAGTHAVAVVQARAQPPQRGPDLALALSEYRPGPMRWAVMTPRAT